MRVGRGIPDDELVFLPLTCAEIECGELPAPRGPAVHVLAAVACGRRSILSGSLLDPLARSF